MEKLENIGIYEQILEFIRELVRDEKEKVEEQKERNYRAIFRKREHRCGTTYVVENGIIYNSIYNFREDIPTKKKLQTFSK